MLVPEINPDEFSPGFMIRVGLVNGLLKYSDVSKAIQSEYHSTKDQVDLKALQLAKILGMDSEEYCKLHTLIPIHRGITVTESETIHGSMTHRFGIKRYGHFGRLKQFKICASCVSEDMDYLGYSYYRRSHQLPGVHTCTKHHQSGKGQLYLVPEQTFLNPDMVNPEALKPLIQYSNPVIERFQEILDGVCLFNQPIDPNRIINQLEGKARSKGISRGFSWRKVLFSDYVTQQLPEEWLSAHFNNIEKKQLGRKFRPLDGVLVSDGRKINSLYYLLAIALLYDNADEALNMLKRSANLSQRKIRSIKRLNKNIWGKDSVEMLCLRHEGVVSAIAGAAGTSDKVFQKN